MAGIEPVNPQVPLLPSAAGRHKLMLRVVSSLVMAPLALGAAYLGDPIFLLFWAIAALGVLWEWDGLVCAHDKNPVFIIGSISLVGIALLWGLDRALPAVLMAGLGILGVATLASRARRSWCVAGQAYATILLLAPVMLRNDPTFGFWAMVFVFAVVWCTDIGAYVAGRSLRGPKLAPGISPNKTWAGAIGGLAAGVAGGILAARVAGIENVGPLYALTVVLSLASQAGDLLESAIKRRFNAKDSSLLIPGHGGLMDRLDGFVTAAAAAAAIGLLHAGIDAPARGLLIW